MLDVLEDVDARRGRGAASNDFGELVPEAEDCVTEEPADDGYNVPRYLVGDVRRAGTGQEWSLPVVTVAARRVRAGGELRTSSFNDQHQQATTNKRTRIICQHTTPRRGHLGLTDRAFFPGAALRLATAAGGGAGRVAVLVSSQLFFDAAGAGAFAAAAAFGGAPRFAGEAFPR